MSSPLARDRTVMEFRGRKALHEAQPVAGKPQASRAADGRAAAGALPYTRASARKLFKTRGQTGFSAVEMRAAAGTL